MAKLKILNSSMRFNVGEVVDVERDLNAAMADTLIASGVAAWVGEPHPASRDAKQAAPLRPRAKVVQPPVHA